MMHCEVSLVYVSVVGNVINKAVVTYQYGYTIVRWECELLMNLEGVELNINRLMLDTAVRSVTQNLANFSEVAK